VYGLRMTRKHRCRLQSPKRANLSPTGLSIYLSIFWYCTKPHSWVLSYIVLVWIHWIVLFCGWKIRQTVL